MSTMTERTAAELQRTEGGSVALGPILVATDGNESSQPALGAALVHARRTGADVVVVTVLEGLPYVTADFGIAIPPIESNEIRRQALEKRVRAQLRTVDPDAEDWPVEVRDGDAAAVIGRRARELGARLIIVGLGHHGMVDRVFGDETAIHVVRMARTPVLAVPESGYRLPERVVVATDFSLASVAAARQALQLMPTLRTVHLVHVAPRIEVQPDAFAAWMNLYGEGIGPAFERLTAEIGMPGSIKVETTTLNGKPAREVLEFARSVKADLVVTASRGAGFVDRLLVGSTATGILRGAECPVLAVPAVSSEGRVSWPSTGERRTIERDDWAKELDAFTRRNVGRLASLEVDDPELGAQAQEHDYPFLGATWDHHDQRVEIMLGDFEGVGRHLTRGISGVTGVDFLNDENGRDWILRVEHGRGQTILYLRR